MLIDVNVKYVLSENLISILLGKFKNHSERL